VVSVIDILGKGKQGAAIARSNPADDADDMRSLTGKGRNAVASRVVKMVVFTPIPRAKAETARMLNPGFRRSARRPKRTSWARS
jgi:hypothetical protein